MTDNKRTEWDWTAIWLDVAATAFSIAAAIILWRILQLIIWMLMVVVVTLAISVAVSIAVGVIIIGISIAVSDD